MKKKMETKKKPQSFAVELSFRFLIIMINIDATEKNLAFPVLLIDLY